MTSDLLIYKGIYKMISMVKDVEKELDAGNEVDFIISCTSFGGTGASLGVNFGEFWQRNTKTEGIICGSTVSMYNPIFFPDPESDDQNQIN